MWKHEVNTHEVGGTSNRPKYSFRIVKFFRTAIERQIYEAVHLKTLAKDPNLVLMNLKGEYTRVIVEGANCDTKAGEQPPRSGKRGGGRRERIKCTEGDEWE